MTPIFSVHVTPHYERLFRKLLRKHPEIAAVQESVREVLRSDPYNALLGRIGNLWVGLTRAIDGRGQGIAIEWLFRYLPIAVSKCSLKGGSAVLSSFLRL